ncbi:MAG: PHP domain-containing protein [Promethearchaeota archaeon]
MQDRNDSGVWDFHVHTKYSGCCKEDYGVVDAYHAAVARGCAGIGVSDHCNYRSFNAGFVYTQREAIERQGLGGRVLVGLEVTMLDGGRLGIHPKYLAALDFVIIAEHLHIAKPFSKFFRVKHKIKKWYAEPSKYQRKIRDFHAKHRELYLKGIAANPRSILAHPFRFTRTRGIFDPVLLDLGEEICEAAQLNEVAIEVHGSFLKAALGADSPHRRFVLEFFKTCGQFDLQYSLGSDAHKLSEVGRFEGLEEALGILGVARDRIITPAFFSRAR